MKKMDIALYSLNSLTTEGVQSLRCPSPIHLDYTVGKLLKFMQLRKHNDITSKIKSLWLYQLQNEM